MNQSLHVLYVGINISLCVIWRLLLAIEPDPRTVIYPIHRWFLIGVMEGFWDGSCHMLSSLDQSSGNFLQQLTGLEIYKFMASKAWFHFMKFRKGADSCSKGADIGFVGAMTAAQIN